MPRNRKFNYAPTGKVKTLHQRNLDLAYLKKGSIQKPLPLQHNSDNNTSFLQILIYIKMHWNKMSKAEKIIIISILLGLTTGMWLLFLARENQTLGIIKGDGTRPNSSGIKFFNQSLLPTNLYPKYSAGSSTLSLPTVSGSLNDSKQKSTVSKNKLSPDRDTNSYEEYVCDETGLCKNQPSIKNPTILSDSMLRERIVLSDYAKKVYNDSYSTFESDRAFIVKSLQDLASKNQRMNCKLQTVFNDNPDLKIRLTTREDPEATAKETIRGMFKYHLNTIMLYVTDIYDTAFSSYLYHEIHHAFVNYENRKNKYLFFTNDKRIWTPMALPCFNNKDGSANCEMISKVLNHGLQNIEALLSFFNHPTASLNKEQASYKQQYLRLIKNNYKPLCMRDRIEASLIAEIKRQKLVDNDFNIITKSGYIRRTDPDLNIKHLYIYKLESINNEIYGLYGASNPEEPDKAPLMDLLYVIERYKNIEQDKKIMEYDAIIHQLYEEYPDLLDHLFPGFNQFHFQRAGNVYQQCMMAK
jgi:hypothetical protein